MTASAISLPGVLGLLLLAYRVLADVQPFWNGCRHAPRLTVAVVPVVVLHRGQHADGDRGIAAVLEPPTCAQLVDDDAAQPLEFRLGDEAADHVAKSE